MLNDDEYEILKKSFIDSQRLFNKLSVVADKLAELDYDESGMFYEEEEVLERHWLKLSSKIVDTLSENLKGYSIELLESKDLQIKELNLNLKDDENISKIYIDFSIEDAIRITQIS